ncbi:hypothetical protein N0V90_002889 [Kalmusia sp. IMI 367209]|nr:hypothetical protein N0V90_002889 [Kalmusia sp. IMI 367209]
MTSEGSNTTAAVTEKSAFAAVGSRDKTVAWYKRSLEKENLPEQTRELLKTYSRIPESEIVTHIEKVGENLVGVELHGEYHDLGHKLFCDGDKMSTQNGGAMRALGATLIGADLFDLLKDDGTEGTSVALQPLLAGIDVLQASAFLHLFTWEKQLDAGAAIVKLMKGPGAMVVGTQVGSKKPGLYEQGRMYLHDVSSFEKLWAEIGERTASEWKVEAVLAQDPREKKPWDDGNVEIPDQSIPY